MDRRTSRIQDSQIKRHGHGLDEAGIEDTVPLTDPHFKEMPRDHFRFQQQFRKCKTLIPETDGRTVSRLCRKLLDSADQNISAH